MSSVGKRIAKLEAQVAQLLALVAERDAEITRLKGRVAELEAGSDAEVIRLRKRVAELEARLGQNSTNSNKPPSSDPPGTRPDKPSSGRRRGAQPGHKPNTRVMLPPEKVTRRSVVKPTACGHCGGNHLTGLDVEPRVHQVIDIPEIVPDVHEYRMHAAHCGDCGTTTWAKLPSSAPAHMFGPRLLAFLGYFLSGRSSRRQVQEMFSEIFGIPISLGALSEAEERVSIAIAGAVDEAAAHVRAAPVKHVDGTTWRREGSYAALWTMATKLVAVFFVVADATAPTIAALLGTLRGIMVTDRGSQFGFWAMKRRQICWAHLIRKFVAFSERSDEAAKLGNSLLLLAQAMLSAWHEVRDGTLSRKRYQVMARNAQQAFERLLECGVELRLRRVSGACADILAHKEALFTFAFSPGVEPTNNQAERVLRPFVLWRKISYGSQSERGCLFASRLMTVAQSLRLQKRSVLAFLVDACHAHASRRTGPSLIPR